MTLRIKLKNIILYAKKVQQCQLHVKYKDLRHNRNVSGIFEKYSELALSTFNCRWQYKVRYFQ